MHQTSRFSFKKIASNAKLIKNLKIPDNHILVSLDVTSLYINIPLDLVMQSVQD